MSLCVKYFLVEDQIFFCSPLPPAAHGDECEQGGVLLDKGHGVQRGDPGERRKEDERGGADSWGVCAGRGAALLGLGAVVVLVAGLVVGLVAGLVQPL